jgi:alpha-galactosidase
VRTALLSSFLLVGCPAADDSGGASPELCREPGVLHISGDTVVYDREDCAHLAMRGRVLGEGSLTVDFVHRDGRLVPVVTAGPEGASLRAVVLEGDVELAGDDDLRWWRQGYQSWSWAGVVALEGQLELDDDGVPEVGGQDVNTSFIQDRAATSWWAGLLGRDGGASLLLGAVDAAQVPFYAAADEAGGLWAVWGGFDEVYELEAEEQLALSPVWFGASDDAWSLWRRYAQEAASANPPRALEAQPTLGWSSWYTYYADVTERDVRDNLAAVAALNDGGQHAPLELLQVDDGWQVVWGEWTANDKFPSGMAALAADIQAEGLTPGLWMAPFYVSRQASAYLEHDDWWVLDSDGVELSFDNDSAGDYAVLDVTHPDAAAFLHQVIAARVAEGWTYLKLDFLYAGAQPGQRYRDVSGLEAFHAGMAILREAAGEEAFILACGAPMLPSLGYAEGFRTGADIAFGWSPDPDPAYLRWQARATAGRAWQNGLWWWIDPDVLLLRAPFTDTQARGAVVAQLISSGLWLAGDDLSALSDEQLALELHPGAAALRGRPVRPHAPLRFVSGHDLGPVAERSLGDDTVPWIWQVGDGTTALLNLGDEPIELLGPGGTELLTGERALAGGVRSLQPGEGEIWSR